MRGGLVSTPAAVPAAGAIRRRKDKPVQDSAPEQPALQPIELELDSAEHLAAFGVQFVAKLRAAPVLSKRRFVVFVVTAGVYVYSSSGTLLQQFARTGSPPRDGVLFHFDGATYEVGTRGDIERVAWEEAQKPHVWQWSAMTEADYQRLAPGDTVACFIIPRSTPAAGATGAPPPDFVPDPAAVPAHDGAPASGPAARPAAAKGAALKRPVSGDEYESGTREGVANYPAFPAKIDSSAALVPRTGASELTMHLDWTYGERELIDAVWNASTRVKYQWERFDITAIVARGAAAKAALEAKKQAAQDPDAKVDDQYIEHESARRARESAEDIDNSMDTIRAGGTPGTSDAERLHDVSTEIDNLALAPVSEIKSAGGFAIDSVWHVATTPDNEITLAWNSPGYFMVRCIATPAEHQGRRYLSSVAATFVEVRDTDYIARDTLARGEAALDELRLRRAMTADPARQARLDTEIAELETTSHGSAVEALEIAVKTKRAETDAAIGRARSRHEDELHGLENQLRIARRNEAALPPGPDGTPVHALRPQAAIASEVTGATYPLVLQLVPMATARGSRWALHDVTTSGDNLGHAFVGTGPDDGAAISDAFRRFAADNDYGRGTVVLRIPTAVPGVGGRELVLRNVKRGDALAKERLHDLITVLVALSLVVPGVGEVAAVLTGAMAAEHIYQRWSRGTLEADASLLNDVVAILGAVGTVAGQLGNLRIISSKKAFAIATESGDAAAIAKALGELETAVSVARAIQIGNEIVGYGGLLWGDLQVVKELESIDAQEASGQLTHAQARSARAKALLGAFQNHAMMFAGPLKDRRPTGVDEPARGRDPAAPPDRLPADTARDSAASGAGAVRGRDSYELRDPAQHRPLRGNDPDIHDQLMQAVEVRQAHGQAELHPTGAPGQYKLAVAGVHGRPAVEVAVKVEMVRGFDAANQPHGGDEGPARLDLVRSGGQWEATIRIHEMARKTDVSRIAGHELDEIIEIIHGTDAVMSDDAASQFAREQMIAEVFRPGAPSGKPPTAHDRAAARELAQAVSDLARARAKKADTTMLERRVAAMKRSMGFDDPLGGRERAGELVAMGLVPAEVMATIGAEAEVARIANAHGVPAPRTMSVERVLHVLRPSPTSAARFKDEGIGGGHVDAELQSLVKNGNAFKLVELNRRVGPDGATYRVYTQELVQRSGTVMAMDGANPLYKTTVDSPHALLDGGLVAFDNWAATNNAKNGPPSSFNKMKNGLWTGTSADGVRFSGFATFDGGVWEIQTIFPEASWVLKK